MRIAPARQNATDTINTLSDRLTSATLLEDRRAAIQGLRSFAKLYPASVASGALRGLISELHRSAEDPDTVKIVLETILGLFEPDEKSPEASEEITLWLADEFTQRQVNITALLDLLEANEFYLRLYVLQILSHVTAARLLRAEEAIFAAPLGVSRITSMLDDRREAVQAQAVALLVAITASSREIQKVVAFENAFDRIFALIDGDGGLSHGSTTVQDCLSLLANLLNLNSSNQSYFREVGGILKIKKLLSAAMDQENSGEGVPPQRDMHVWGLLGVMQLFLAQGAQGTNVNQQAFWQSGTLEAVLRISFHTGFSAGVRTKSLEACGDMIRGNQGLQERFGDLGVSIKEPDSPPAKGNGVSEKQQPPQKAKFRAQNVIESLLQLTLEPAPLALFDLRLAAASCVEAFMKGHLGIRTHVLKRAIDGHKAGDDAIPNMLTVLLEPSLSRSNSDPYQQWFAALLLLHLMHESPETKEMASGIQEGDAENGEEVITFAQIIAGNIFTGVRQEGNERALIGSLMVLSFLLFENPHAVNDLLQEASYVQGLTLALNSAKETMPLVAGISAFVLGIIYEFSTKDSPISRSTLHDLLISSPGREAYVDRLTKLRQNVFVRDFEFIPQTSEGGLPEVFFDKSFIDFFKDNYSRFLRAIDKDPNVEVSVLTNGGAQNGIPRDLIDSLRAQVEEQRQALEAAKVEYAQDLRRCEQRCSSLLEQATRDNASTKLRLSAEISGLQRQISEHASEAGGLKRQIADHTAEAGEVKRRISEHAAETGNLKQKASEHSVETARLKQQVSEHATETNQLQRQISAQASAMDSLHRDIEVLNTDKIASLQRHIAELKANEDKANQARDEHAAALETATARASTLGALVRSLVSRLGKVEEQLTKDLANEKAGRKDVQTELDDLLVVFGDLEAKRSEDKKKLKELGQEVSEDEEDENEDEDEDDEVIGSSTRLDGS